MRGPRTAHAGWAAIAALLLSACAPQVGSVLPAMAPPPIRPGPPALIAPSKESLALRAYYSDLQASLLSRGLMRTDAGSRDAPFDARMLADNFIKIALYDEFDGASGTLVARATESHLRRWAVPIRFGLHFGASVPATRRATERARVASYLSRLARLTGLSIRLADSGANYQLWIVDEDERRALASTISAAMPGITASEIAAFTQMAPSTYCQVSAMVDNGTSLYRRAFAVIRAEHPDLFNLSCLHEEIAQGLGLPNDSPQARPSIFNDDQEFALLTPMDELMLRMLYDPRMRPGMTVAEARPIAIEIANEYMNGAT